MEIKLLLKIQLLILYIILVDYSYSQTVVTSISYDSLTNIQTVIGWSSLPDSTEIPQENDIIIFGIKKLNDVILFTDSNINEKKRYRVLTTKTNLPYYCELKNVEYIKANDYILIEPFLFGMDYSYISRREKSFAEQVIKVLDSNLIKKYSLEKMIQKFREDSSNCNHYYGKSKTQINNNMYYEELKTNQFMIGVIRIRVLQRFCGKTFEKSHLTGLYIPFAIPLYCGDKW